MQAAMSSWLFLSLVLLTPAVAMRHPARGPVGEGQTTNETEHLGKVTHESVTELHHKLEVVLHGLKGMVDGKHGALAKAKVAPALQVFIKELETTLASTTDAKDTEAAMHKLNDAEAGLKTLMHELTQRQEALMMEDESEHESLLLGVLMSKQHEPMENQRKVLQSEDFVKLPVAKALLASKNSSAALYVQAADFLDAHRSKAAVVKEQTVATRKAAATEKLAASLDKRVASMERELKMKEASHKRRVQILAKSAKSAKSQKERHLAESLQRREVRSFKKFSAVRAKDIASMKAAVDAIKSGDVKALERARKALMDSLQALKSQNGGFLVLLSLGHRNLGGDCPYCAAQCIDKCKQNGKSYVTCLGDCAEAGKSF